MTWNAPFLDLIAVPAIGVDGSLVLPWRLWLQLLLRRCATAPPVGDITGVRCILLSRTNASPLAASFHFAQQMRRSKKATGALETARH